MAVGIPPKRARKRAPENHSRAASGLSVETVPGPTPGPALPVHDERVHVEFSAIKERVKDFIIMLA